MSEHPNATAVREFIEGLRHGDLAAFDAIASPDLVWHFPGQFGKLAGQHRGREEVIDFLARVLNLTDGTFGVELIDVVANDRRAVAIFRGRASREGRELDNPTCLSMRFRGGRVVELWEFVWDLYDVDKFWS